MKLLLRAQVTSISRTGSEVKRTATDRSTNTCPDPSVAHQKEPGEGLSVNQPVVTPGGRGANTGQVGIGIGELT